MPSILNKHPVLENHVCDESDAAKFVDWIRNRGGLAIWQSINLSNPSASWTTPRLGADGLPTTKPSWQSADKPERVITDPNEVDVVTYKEVKRFHVAVKVGGSMNLVVSDGGSRRIRSAVAKAGDGAYNVFDYSTQEAVIMKPESTIPLVKWMEAK